jgi:hypothetical protein
MLQPFTFCDVLREFKELVDLHPEVSGSHTLTNLHEVLFSFAWEKRSQQPEKCKNVLATAPLTTDEFRAYTQVCHELAQV